MRKLLTLLLISTTIIAVAQKKQKDTSKVRIPIKDGSIFFEYIVDGLESQKQGLIFDNSLKWMANSFVDSKEVIQIKDKETGSIVGAGVFDMKLPGFVGTTYRISFRIEITARDNKSRIRFYQFDYKFLGTSTPDVYSSLDTRYKNYIDGNSPFPGDDKKCFTILNQRLNEFFISYSNYLKNNSKPDDF